MLLLIENQRVEIPFETERKPIRLLVHAKEQVRITHIDALDR